MELTSAHKNWIALAIFVLGCLAIGFSSSLLSSASSGYTGLDMPPLSPPGILFPIAWTILYVLMGISIWSVYRNGGDKLYYILFAVQLVLNFVWTPIFFTMGDRMLALADLTLLWITVFAMIYFVRENKLAFYTLIPYILWLTFAAYLNIGAILLN